MLPPRLYFFVVLVHGSLTANEDFASPGGPKGEWPKSNDPIGNEAPMNGTILAEYFVEYHNWNSTVNTSITMKWIDSMVKVMFVVKPSPDYPLYVLVNNRICNNQCWANMERDGVPISVHFSENPSSFFYVIRHTLNRYVFFHDTCMQPFSSKQCRLRRADNIFICICDGVEVCDRSSPPLIEKMQCAATIAKPKATTVEPMATTTETPTTTTNAGSTRIFKILLLYGLCSRWLY